MSSILEKLKVLVALLSNDKVKHFVFCMAIAALLVPFGYTVMYAGVATIAIAKEVADKLGTGTPDFLDFVAGMVGAAALHAWYEVIIKFDLVQLVNKLL